MSGPLTIVGLIALLLALAMGGSAPGPIDDLLPPAATRTIGSPPEVASRPPTPLPPHRTPEPEATTGALEIRVEDAQGRRRDGVRLEIDGPVSGRQTTGADGTVRLEPLPPGRYDVEVPAGCVGDLEIFQGRRGTAQVSAGRLSVLRLGGIDARARYWPSLPARWSSAPSWRVGVTVTITFSIDDRCTPRDARPGTSFSRLAWAPNEVVTIIGTAPNRVDANASATIRFRCERRGTPRLLLWDPGTGEQQDVLELSPGIDLEPACA